MNRKKIRKISIMAKLAAFGVTLAVMTVIGLMWFLRPEVSETEKRKLTPFPRLTLSSFLDGSFFSDVELWYADTYPTRELLVKGNASVKALYGKKSEQLVGDVDKQADDIPVNDSQPVEATLPPAAQTETTTSAPEPETAKDGTVDTAEKINDIYVNGGSGYALYFFLQENSDWYAAVINEAQKKFDGKAEVYSVIAPINSGIMLSDELQKELNASNQREAIEYIYGKMNDKVHKVRMFDTLRNHCDEYIYFRTDHHWSALGAYYGYTCFAKEKGFTPHRLDDYEKVSYDGFLGTFYSSTQSAKMEAEPDTIIAYKPVSTNRMTLKAHNGEVMNWNIIDDVSNYGASVKFSCFVCGDMPISWAENPQITDGSACVVIKDSYGNAFVPFLVDHYQTVYWIDYRYYDESFEQFVEEKGIDDIIFLQNIYNTAYKTAIGNIQNLIES